MSELLLAGDLGGTKINMALFRRGPERPELVREGTLKTAGTSGIEPILDEFLGDDRHRVEAACIGVAGPVRDGRARMVNVGWAIDRRDIERHLGVGKVELINDLVATGYGVEVLPPDQIATLNEGREDPAGNGALIAAGTGLGEALLIRRDDGGFEPEPSEGGHCDFAPVRDIEIDLLRFSSAKFGRTSYERVLSGPGIRHIYEFLKQRGDFPESPEIAEQMREGDPSAVISQAALEQACPLCDQAMDLFATIYGAEAGNLALKTLAVGGVYLGGGIAPKILPLLRGPHFMNAFNHKGRLSEFMAGLPVRVILEPRAALLGAAHRAEML